MTRNIATPRLRRNRPLSPLKAERHRLRALPAIRLLTGRFALPFATAVLTAETLGMHTGGDR